MPSFFKNRSSGLLPERDPLRVERVLEVLHVIMENFFLQFSLETSIFGRKDTADFVRRLLSCRDLNLRKAGLGRERIMMRGEVWMRPWMLMVCDTTLSQTTPPL